MYPISIYLTELRVLPRSYELKAKAAEQYMTINSINMGRTGVCLPPIQMIFVLFCTTHTSLTVFF